MAQRQVQDPTLRLRDGRRLCYREGGARAGAVVFFFHGNPGSRLARHPDASIAERRGLRVISVDRPGYGYSDYQAGRRLLDWPQDVAQLADALGIGRFAVAGWSSGGPHALACCAVLGDRVTRAALIASGAPAQAPGVFQGMNSYLRTGWQMADQMYSLFRLMLRMQTQYALNNRTRVFSQTIGMLSAGDQAILQRQIIRAQVAEYLPEAARQGIDGMARETRILVMPWGFDLDAVRQPVGVWYWADDVITPPPMGRYLAQSLPGAEACALPGGGHYAWFDIWPEILDFLQRG